MATDFPDTGVFHVNGEWATAVRFEARMRDRFLVDVDLGFLNDHGEIARARLRADDARALLGERNFAAVANAGVAQAGSPGSPLVKGELRGASLQFGRATLPEIGHPSNAITPDDSAKAGDEPSGPGHKGSDGNGNMLRAAASARVPDAVAARFVKAGDDYFFPDRTLAFSDRGRKLKARTNNVEVIRSLVEIVEARGWHSIRVTGAEAFRREVWREASSRGMDVAGYEPMEIDRARLDREAARRGSGERSSPPTGDDRGSRRAADIPDLEQERTSAEPAGTAREASRTLLKGRLVDAGAAPYKFDPKRSLSYFVRLRTEQGDITLWGVDLERALVESHTRVHVGDLVAVESRGSQHVTVRMPRRDDAGNLVGEQKVAAHRNVWTIEKPSWFEERAASAAAFRDPRVQKEELVQRHPGLTNAVVSLWLGEQFAATRIERAEDRDKVVAALRERLASALERGDEVRAPRLKPDTARKLDTLDRGYSPPSVAPEASRPRRDFPAQAR